ncbi:MAG: hypothetical protein Q7V58_10425 [Actinomycetota bacterium]|nr:hypothetical protein [Actinomycetota bacterium]
MTMDCWLMFRVLRSWSSRRWLVAILGGAATAVLVAVPTAVIPNPVFGRAIDVTWWSYPVVVLTGILGGLLVATYVREDADPGPDTDRASRLGVAGGLVSFFAVGCPVCNKLVLLALGASGAVTWFAPLQPFLAVLSIALMAVALRIRLRNQASCRVENRR